MRKCAAEVLGTFALVFAGTGAIVIDDVSGGTVSHVGISLTFGLIVLAMIYAIGDVSGAHLNCGESIQREASMTNTALKRVVFVCIENANRSQIAEAFARMLGAGRVEAHSAGSRPSGRINPKAIEAMKEVGYDLSKHDSKSLSDLPDEEFDVAVTMGCGDQCPLLRAKRREDWNIPDPREMPPDQFRQVRNLIEEKVKDLLGRL